MTGTDAPRTFAPPAGAVTEPVGAVVSILTVVLAGLSPWLPTRSLTSSRYW
ncbi:MAG TPA: hypothetical protein VM290_05145 [Gaiellaceae bacterium]|nr:hypothetical protein [Gaiellaceae bacterium]